MEALDVRGMISLLEKILSRLRIFDETRGKDESIVRLNKVIYKN